MSRFHQSSALGTARHHLELAVFESGVNPNEINIGRITKIGAGIDRQAFHVGLEGKAPWNGDFVILIPNQNTSPETHAAWIQETKLLSRLNKLQFCFRIPTIIASVVSPEGTTIVERYLAGGPLLFKPKFEAFLDPIPILAKTASEIHAVNLSLLDDIFPTSLTYREFAFQLLQQFENENGAALQNARNWCLKHMPEETPCTLIHGDLLGQNILVSILGADWSVIDWTSARLGDPAYEFAILTRGARKPFPKHNDVSRLLDQYSAFSGHLVTSACIRFYEVLLVMGWLKSKLIEEPMSGTNNEYKRLLLKLCVD